MKWFCLFLLAFLPVAGWGAERSAALAASAPGLEAAAAAAAGEGSHEPAKGLPPDAPRIKLGPFTVTNSMILTWVVAVFLIVFAQMATRNIQAVPAGAQNFWEWMVESLHDFLEGIIGHDLVKKGFWFFATLFIFILFTNWFGLIPGVGTVGWGVPDASGHLHHLDRPLLRGANADLNMTSAMAVTFCVLWLVWALQANGPGGFLKHIFGYSGDATGGLKAFLVLVFLAVGVLEVISIAFRPVSLSFRLYGNIFAGENLLESMAHMGGKYFGWLVPIPFYFLELIVGLVQALVFMLLTAIFTSLICSHGDSHEGHEHKSHGH
ncbi:MAG: F0F1 ATP synthase subunit A [Verrucomicrobia bacterium]|nr:F0F1 ATP synthase subunit A [Verrucomicrobiota bacterium]